MEVRTVVSRGGAPVDPASDFSSGGTGLISVAKKSRNMSHFFRSGAGKFFGLEKFAAVPPAGTEQSL